MISEMENPLQQYLITIFFQDKYHWLLAHLPRMTSNKTEAYIRGAWVGDRPTFSVFNPANGSLVASVTNCVAADADAAIQAASEALPSWKKLPAKVRVSIFLYWHHWLIMGLSVLLSSRDLLTCIASRNCCRRTTRALRQFCRLKTWVLRAESHCLLYEIR